MIDSIGNTNTSNIDTISKLIETRYLTKSAYIMRFDRNNMEFKPGQHITLGISDDNQVREYSIYSATDKPYLEVLVKEVDNGLVSKRLKKCKSGDALNVDGPFGFFMLDKKNIGVKKHLFIATGTGISPFHSIIGSYHNLDYKIIHGVRYSEEAYEKQDYDPEKYNLCTSRDEKSDFNGRVTDYLKNQTIDPETLVYLCGNCDMIYEVYDLLTSGGMSSDNIRTEVYF